MVYIGLPNFISWDGFETSSNCFFFTEGQQAKKAQHHSQAFGCADPICWAIHAAVLQVELQGRLHPINEAHSLLNPQVAGKPARENPTRPSWLALMPLPRREGLGALVHCDFCLTKLSGHKGCPKREVPKTIQGREIEPN